MVIDSSALLSIVFGEPERDAFVEVIFRATDEGRMVYIPATVIVEAGMAAERRRHVEKLDGLLARITSEIVPLDYAIAQLARAAHRRFGRGFHKAALNFGDCMTYATALYLRAPLLYKGDDFRRTGIPSALPMPN